MSGNDNLETNGKKIENTQQKNEQTTKKETDLTEISKFEWKKKTCEEIIEDMRNIKKMFI